MKLAICWGFFAPLHVAHLDLFRAAKSLTGDYGKLVVLVNNDEQLAAKKNGLVVMNEWDRAQVVSQIKSVDHALIVSDALHGRESILSVIDYYLPEEVIMCMGGDKSNSSNIDPNLQKLCDELHIRIQYGVGGFTKDRSSSEIIDKVIEWWGKQ